MAKKNETPEVEQDAAPEAGKNPVTFEISTPNPTFSGTRDGLKFRDGKATTNNEKQAAGLAGLGYSVKKVGAVLLACAMFLCCGSARAASEDRTREIVDEVLAAKNRAGVIYFVDANTGNNSANGLSWDKAFLTMAHAFAQIRSGDTIIFRGNVREQLTTPVGAADVTIIGAGNRPRHADTHPLNGELSTATWRLPASGSTNAPLLIIRNPGWRIENVLFAAHASNYALRLERNAVEDATEQDASHLSVIGCRFASGAGGISDTGGCADVLIKHNRFEALTAFAILGVGNIGVGQSDWEIVDNTFEDMTNGVKIAAFECRIQNNTFTDGGTPNTTVVLNTNNGGGANNIVVGNFFQTATANFNTPDIVGTSTDVWNNVSIDGEANMIGHEVGVPQ